MFALFSFLRSGAKFVTEERVSIGPIFGSWRNHPKIGQWYPRDGAHSAVGVYRCLGCGKLAERGWLTETEKPAEQDSCRVLAEKYPKG